MMLLDNGWFDWMERLPGPREKLWNPNELHTPQGVVLHSAVGTLQGVINIVFGPASNNRSVTGVFGKQGEAIQFYSVFDAPWANGTKSVNLRYRGFEHEGGIDTPATVSEPLTEAQIECDVRMMRDMQAKFGLVWERPSNAQDMIASEWEHKEMTRFGAAPTACPSNRIPWDTINKRLSTPPVARYWVAGDTMGGLEKHGNQMIVWNNGVPGNVYGDWDGKYPGALYHLVGPNWEKDWVEIYR